MREYIVLFNIILSASAWAAEPPLTWAAPGAAAAPATAVATPTGADGAARDIGRFIDAKTMESIRADVLADPSAVAPSSPERPPVAAGKKNNRTDAVATPIDQKPSGVPRLDPFAVPASVSGSPRPSATTPGASSASQSTLAAESAPAGDGKSILSQTSSSVRDGAVVGGTRESRGGEIVITDTKKPSRGINVRHEMPSVRHITMSPGNKWFGGDDVEIAISPIFDIVMQMPDAVDWFNPSSDSLVVEKVPKTPNLLKLKLKPIDNPVPMSLQVVDVYQKIWTFTVVGVKADLAMEYPKTIMINKKIITKTIIGAKNPNSIINALPIDYAVQVAVGDAPNTSEFKIEPRGATYMHHEGYATYLFAVSRKDGSAVEKTGGDVPNLKFTMWANNHRIDGGSLASGGSAGTGAQNDPASAGLTRDVEWTVDTNHLSKSETRRNGRETYIVICQVRASILDLEDWGSAFITVSDSTGYTRLDFLPYSRDFRAPGPNQDSGEN
jgi:hypothetical protein